jgi:hypothetical protein
VGVDKALDITAERRFVAQEVVCERRRLGGLEVCVARHRRLDVDHSHARQCLAQIETCLGDL